MKLDIKSWAIIILLGGFIIFFSLWYFRKPIADKSEINLLNNQIASIQKQKDSLSTDRKILQANFDLLNNKYNNQNKSIDSLSRKISINTIELDKTKSNFNNLLASIKKSNDQINSLQNNPTKENKDQLLNSLIKKLNVK